MSKAKADEPTTQEAPAPDTLPPGLPQTPEPPAPSWVSETVINPPYEPPAGPEAVLPPVPPEPSAKVEPKAAPEEEEHERTIPRRHR